MTILLRSSLSLAILLSLAGCDSGPCSGGGMAEDKRALPEPWAAAAPAPAGAVACHAEDGSSDEEWVRSYELGKSAEEGKTQWTTHLTGKGWTDTGETKDDDTYLQSTFEKDGAKLAVQCSKKLTDKGWCTLTFTKAG